MKLPLRARTRFAGHWLVLFFALVCPGLHGASPAKPPPDGDKIISALVREHSVIASTATGLYEAPLDTETWRKMDTPSNMVPGGFLVQQDAKSPRLGYITSFDMRRAAGKDAPTLFLSQDGGKHWKASALGKKISSLDFLPNGMLYAIVQDAPKDGGWSMDLKTRLLSSQDDGRSWTDISPPLDRSVEFARFIEDPVHPNRLNIQLFEGIGFLGLLVLGENGRTWDKRDSDGEDNAGWLLRRRELGWTSGQGDSYQTRAGLRLSDYFKNPIPETVASGMYDSYPAFRIVPEKTTYTFRQGDPMVVPLEIRFWADGKDAKWLENQDVRDLWHVGMVTYGKEPGLDSGHRGMPTPSPGAAFRSQAKMETFRIDRSHPLSREIDLAKLHDFSKPGVYRIQLYHSEEGFVPKGGIVGSPVIDLIVTKKP